MKTCRLLAFSLLALLTSSGLSQISFDQPVKWRTYKSGQFSSITQESQHIINNFAEWQRYWSQSTGQAAATAPRDVDFNREKLIAIHLGNRPTTGYSVMVRSVEFIRAGQIRVSYDERQPDGGVTGSAVTSPYEIVRMDRVAGQIDFQKKIVKGPAIGEITRGVQWRTYQAEQTSRIDAAATRVITTRAQFEEYWQSLTGNSLAPDDVDFRQEQLVAIHIGRRNTTGYDVLPTAIEPIESGAFLLHYLEKAPSSGQRVRNQATSPYVILRMPRVADLRFSRHIWNSDSGLQGR